MTQPPAYPKQKSGGVSASRREGQPPAPTATVPLDRPGRRLLTGRGLANALAKQPRPVLSLQGHSVENRGCLRRPLLERRDRP